MIGMETRPAHTTVRSTLAGSILVTSLAFVPICMSAQSMELLGGTLTVSQGTRIALNGPILWTLAPEAQVVNDGRIELGEEAILVESDAAPIVGLGTEHALIAQGGALSALDAGGLGLTITTTGIGNTEVIRGHQPLLNNGVDEGIARWYRLDPPPTSGTGLDLLLRYASSELNGHDGSTLALFIGDTQAGPWSFVPSTADGNARTVLATWDGPWSPLITAFPQGISTNLAAPDVAAEFAVWPNPSADVLWVRSNNETVEQLELLDPSGRTVRELRAGMSAETATLSLQGLPSGFYVLRMNGVYTAPVVKE